MPSSVASGPKFRSIRGGGKYRIAPDFLVTRAFVAADAGSANSGFHVFTIPALVRGAVFLGATVSWTTAGTNTIRVKKIVAGNTSAPGAAADANNVDLTAAQAVTGSANVPVDIVPITTNAVNVLNPGDRIAVASAAGVASLAGGLIVIRFAWL